MKRPIMNRAKSSLDLPTMDELLETWKPTRIVKRSKSMNLVQGLSQFRHMDYVSEYSVKPQDYTKPRRTATNAGSFSRAGESIARLDSSRGISSPTLKHQLTNRWKSQQRATTLHGSKKRFIKKRLSAVDINAKIAMDEYKKTIALKESEELRRKREEESRNQQALRNRGKHASEILRENNKAKVREAVALAKKRVKQRGKRKNDVPQQLLPFGIGQAKNSWFDQHFKPKEEDDESLYRDKVQFFLRMQSKSKSKVLERDRKSWSNPSPYIGSVVERGLINKQKVDYDYDINVDILRYPADPSRSSIASTTNSSRARTYHAAFNPSINRFHSDSIKHDGPGPNMKQSSAFCIRRPNNPSYAFIAASRAKAHTNPIL